jgi:signal transduction histidine kinase/CheY-like chemotaxis protein
VVWDLLIGILAGREVVGKVAMADEEIEQLRQEIERLKKEASDREWGMRKTNQAIHVLYKDLEKKNEELKKFDQLKSDFVSTVSHELRTPLSISTEGINLVLDGIVGPVNEEQKDLLRTAKDNLSRLNSIINDLLDISKIEAGKITLKRGLVDMRMLLEKFADTYQTVLATKRQSIERKLPDGPFLVYADRDKIIQVITNLFNNAHKFTPEQGKMELELKAEEGHILCRVKDTGVGISAEDMPKLFGKFEQFGRTHGPGIKGTGLGLTISKALIELHGGRIWAESNPCEGTVFFFTLPTYEKVKRDFDHQLAEVLEVAQSKKQIVSLIAIHLSNGDLIKERYGEKMLIETVNMISEAASKIISRPSDKLILYDVTTIYAVLPETNRLGGIAVIKRLRDAIGECAFHIEERGDLKIQFGRAAYPFEGRTVVDLMRAASQDVTRRRCVLIVDDNPEIFQALQADFEGKNVDFELCDSGEKAFEAIRRKIPDLIILDIMSSRMNGYELLGRIKHNIVTTSIPVIILSDKVRGDIEKEFKELGEIPIVAKDGWHEELVYFIDNIT